MRLGNSEDGVLKRLRGFVVYAWCRLVPGMLGILLSGILGGIEELDEERLR